MPPPPAASPGSKWLGPLAGLAAGGLLASLFMGGGLNGFKLFDLLLIGLLIVGAIALFRALRRKAEPVSAKAANTMQYDYAGAGTPSAPPARFESARALAPEIDSKLMSGRTMEAAIQVAPRIPADFEIEPFLRQARAAFIRLQAANDARDIDDIRDFTTPEMYAELSLQIQQRGATLQRTDILKLDVQLLEVVNEGSRAIASVRYSGEIREEIGKLSETFDEVWHVVKRLDIPHATWLLAGIQQIA